MISPFQQLVFSQRTADPSKHGCTIAVARCLWHYAQCIPPSHVRSNEASPVGHVTNCDLAHAFVRMYLGADTVLAYSLDHMLGA